MTKLGLFLTAVCFPAFAFSAKWEPILKSHNNESWTFSENENIQLSINTLDAAAAKPKSTDDVKSYVEKQELVRSWLNRVLGVSNFKIEKYDWDAKTAKLSFTGSYKIGAELYSFREEHSFTDKLKTRQVVWPSSYLVADAALTEIWEMNP